MNRSLQLAAMLVVLLHCTSRAMAGWATFSRTTDTISVNANTQLGSAFTIEAVIRPRELQHGTMGGGMVWNEWQQNAEDKHVVLTPARGLRTFFYPNGGFPSCSACTTRIHALGVIPQYGQQARVRRSTV